MVEAFENMTRAGLTPNAFAHNTLVEAFSHVGEMPRAQELLQQIDQQGLQPKASAYASLLAAYRSSGGEAGHCHPPVTCRWGVRFRWVWPC